MLRKLMKHEFRATSRVMLPLYLVLLVTALGANFTTRGLMDTEYRILDVISVLLAMAFGIAIIGVCVMSVVIMVERFYKNLLQDEGYVMLTLPVSIHQQIWSKLLVSTMWFVVTGIMVVLACCILAFDLSFVGDFFRLLGDLFRGLLGEDPYLVANGTAMLGELAALFLLGCFTLCLQFYAALAMGHSFARHKMACSVACFFGLQFVMQVLVSAVVIFTDTVGLDVFLAHTFHFEGMAAMHVMMLFGIASTVVYGAVFYFLTTFFLKKKLNLE